MTMLVHCDNQNMGEGSPCAVRLSRGLKVMLSVVLGRATRACVNHITGITCEGVVVSSDVFNCPARRRCKRFYLPDVVDSEKSSQLLRSRRPRSLSLSPGLGKPHAVTIQLSAASCLSFSVFCVP